MTLVVNPKYNHLKEWVTRLPETFASQGEVLYDARNQIRRIAAPDGCPVCVKRFHSPRFLNRLVYSFMRPPKAVRAYKNAVLLQEHGVFTPEPIAYLLQTQGGLLGESYLVCRYSSLSRNFYEFRHHPLEGYEPVVKAFARFTAHMHEQGILHLDYSPGNILFDIDDQNGQVQFEIVDINRMQFDQFVSLDTACRNFCRLWGKEDFFRLLAREYAQTRGFDADTCTSLTLKYWKRFWRFRK